jgi:hypothetical protein
MELQGGGGGGENEEREEGGKMAGGGIKQVPGINPGPGGGGVRDGNSAEQQQLSDFFSHNSGLKLCHLINQSQVH